MELPVQFEGRRRTSHVPNLTPLIDIVFLLLIFFMLTSHFVRDEVINIDLPEADSGEALVQAQQIEVVITKEGQFSVSGQTLSLIELENRLKYKLKGQKEKVIRIRGDEFVDLGIAIAVFDAARKAGALSIDIVTVKQPKAPIIQSK
jgi:biopolymer transport protein ExbD